MTKYVNKIIYYLFYILFFVTPLLLNPYSSEVFEFNKMLFVYLITILVTVSWSIKMIVRKKLIFRRSLLDIPLIIFLLSQIASTLFSIDTTTSVFGYYSRFHGGLLSTFSYLLLYWAFVANMDKKTAKKGIYAFLASSFLVTFYGILQHFGIDKNVWIQDVQERIFSTLGQPNWLAAWLVAIIPLALSLSLEKEKKRTFWLGAPLSFLLFAALLFTKSRSGLLGFGVSFGAFWILVFSNKKSAFFKNYGKKFLTLNTLFFALIIIIGTPWTPKLGSLFGKSNIVSKETTQKEQKTPALNITPSGEIRKIVWKGAIGVWKKYPILGSGVETFAFSYYQSRPPEHNLVSEWDFLYNKAHNEYLNFLATTGVLGLLAYLLVITTTIFQLFKNHQKSEKKATCAALLSGYLSILVTNFFGFSVVPVAILFFLFPAVAQSLGSETKEREINNVSSMQKTLIAFLFFVSLILINKLINYYRADYYYARGKTNNSVGYYHAARQKLQKAIELRGFEANYWDELTEASAKTAVYLSEDGQDEISQDLALSAQTQALKALSLSPYNIHVKRHIADYYISLSQLESGYLEKAKEVLLEASELSPTDAKIKYNLALIFLKKGELSGAQKYLQEAILLKTNYKSARYAYALTLIDQEDEEAAAKELRYILENIDPNDERAREKLIEIKK